MKEGECQILYLYSVISLMTDRKKSRFVYAPLKSAFVRVKVCLLGARFVFDQSIC